MRRNNNLASAGVPAPFIVLQDVYRLMGSQWMLINTYFTRDLNNIEWTLQGGIGNHEATPEMFKSTLRSLFFIRRRINRYKGLIQAQLISCQDRGKSSWNMVYGPDSVQMKIVDEIAKELVKDYTQIESLMSHSFARLEQSIRHITSETGIKETERANEQNKILLVLTFVATFFLPINAIAAVLNLTGDWAPQHANFGLFWAVCIPLSALLTAILIVLRYWGTIRRRFGHLRHMKKSGLVFQSMA
jgi:Mg2+ and Co2+ transporter CorA